jgi:hypothetical protein
MAWDSAAFWFGSCIPCLSKTDQLSSEMWKKYRGMACPRAILTYPNLRSNPLNHKMKLAANKTGMQASLHPLSDRP